VADDARGEAGTIRVVWKWLKNVWREGWEVMSGASPLAVGVGVVAMSVEVAVVPVVGSGVYKGTSTPASLVGNFSKGAI